MPGDFSMKDPEQIWQNQPTEPLKMSANDLRRKAADRQLKARFEALSTILIGIILCLVFAWSFARARNMLARMGWGLLSLCGIYAAYHAYQWIWPGHLSEEAPIGTCLEFYRRALERKRDYQYRWWRSGLPGLFVLGMVMGGLGTGASNAALQHPLLNALPVLLILGGWVVAFLLMRKKLGREDLQRQIDELRAFERESR
jgi:hypothetical protein